MIYLADTADIAALENLYDFFPLGGVTTNPTILKIIDHGIEVVADIVQNTIDFNLNTKVLAASFKTVDQIYRVSMSGAHSATISPELLIQLVKHPMTDISVKTFIADGKGLYDIP